MAREPGLSRAVGREEGALFCHREGWRDGDPRKGGLRV